MGAAHLARFMVQYVVSEAKYGTEELPVQGENEVREKNSVHIMNHPTRVNPMLQ
jgi:hypothetical protein